MFDSPRIFHRDPTHFGVIMEQNNYRLNSEMIIWLETGPSLRTEDRLVEFCNNVDYHDSHLVQNADQVDLEHIWNTIFPRSKLSVASLSCCKTLPSGTRDKRHTPTGNISQHSPPLILALGFGNGLFSIHNQDPTDHGAIPVQGLDPRPHFGPGV